MQANQSAAGPRRLADMLPMALSLLETMPGGALLYDPSGTVLGINATGRRMFGLKARDVIGRRITEFCPDSQLQTIVRTGLPSSAQRVLQGGNPYVRMELPVFADGRVVAVLAHFISRDSGILREILPKLPGGEVEPELESDLFREEQAQQSPSLVEVPGITTFHNILGVSRGMRDARSLAGRAARTELPVLIHGEPGTEVAAFAQAIHYGSDRRRSPFLAVDCRLAPEEALAGELFGMGIGGGTVSEGRLEAAASGTLYLDEVSTLPIGLQARLLRQIQERGIGRGGASGPRLIASTSRDLAADVAAGGFREDLYYRLNVIRLDIPPLRSRPEDIRILAEGCIAQLNQLHANQGCARRLSSESLEVLLRYSWPGNLAEFESVLGRAHCMTEGEEILPKCLPAALQQISRVPPEVIGQKTLDEIVAEVERGVILQALRVTGQNRSRTAKLLGLPRSSFYEKLTRYGLMGNKTGTKTS